MTDVLIITADNPLADDRAAVDEFARDVAGSLAAYIREADVLLSGAEADAWGKPLGADEILPPLSDPEQRRRLAGLKALLETTRRSPLLH